MSKAGLLSICSKGLQMIISSNKPHRELSPGALPLRLCKASSSPEARCRCARHASAQLPCLKHPLRPPAPPHPPRPRPGRAWSSQSHASPRAPCAPARLHPPTELRAASVTPVPVSDIPTRPQDTHVVLQQVLVCCTIHTLSILQRQLALAVGRPGLCVCRTARRGTPAASLSRSSARDTP